jgi:hypothetical protein
MNWLLLCTKQLSPYLDTPFASYIKEMDKVDDSDAKKMELMKIEFLVDPANQASKYSLCFAIYS